MLTAKNVYVLLAKEVTTDSLDQMNSIIKIVDRFIFNIDIVELSKKDIKLGEDQIGLPASYAIATSWRFNKKLDKDTKVIFKAMISDPDGKILDNGPEQTFEIPAGLNKVNLNINALGLPVTREGEYEILVQLLSTNKKLLAENSYNFMVEMAR